MKLFGNFLNHYKIDEKWNQTSSRAVFIVKNNERCNLSPTFINDAFLYSWIILTD
jgi:hypothetical protein